MALLLVRGVDKSFGAVRALDGASLSVSRGTLTAVLGPSGCGKTTLLRAIAGFERVDSGTIEIDGRTVATAERDVQAHRRRVAVVPQEGALFPHLSVVGNVAYGLGRTARRNGRVDEVLALVGLEGHGDRMPHQLSGGQQQRVALARALAPRPRLVLLDEPFSSLDAGLRAELRHDVRAALHADGATAVLVTHDQGEALSIADQVAVMREGHIVQSGTPAEIYHRPADAWLASFVGEANLLPGSPAGQHAGTALGSLVLADPGAVAGAESLLVLVRPEQLTITSSLAAARADAAGGGRLGTVRQQAFHGHDALITVELTDGRRVMVRTLGAGLELAEGDRVTVTVNGPVRAFAEGGEAIS
jgi:iron(III) transport system ATP-binding protein